MRQFADKAVYTSAGTPLSSRAALHRPVPVRRVVPLPNSHFELIASETERLPPHLGNVLGELLHAVYSAARVGRPVLLPLWAEEGMHRAYAMLRLLGRQAERDGGRVKSDLCAGVEYALARSLAAAYALLATPNEDEIVPCSTLLREVVLNLGALFGSRDGIVVTTAIERLNLPAYKRRALVLSASELMLNALTHAFHNRSHDRRIDVSLRLLDKERACLRVSDNGAGFGSRHPDTTRSVAGGLANLVEADLAYYRTEDWMTAAEIIFPSDGAVPAGRQTFTVEAP